MKTLFLFISFICLLSFTAFSQDDTLTWKQDWKQNGDYIPDYKDIQFSTDGVFFVDYVKCKTDSSFFSGFELWDASNGEFYKSIPYIYTSHGFRVSADNKYIAAAYMPGVSQEFPHFEINILNVNDGNPVRTDQAREDVEKSYIDNICILPDSKRYAYHVAFTSQIYLCDISTGDVIDSIIVGQRRNVWFSDNGDLAAVNDLDSATSKYQITIWSLSEGNIKTSLKTDVSSSLIRFSADGRHLLTCYKTSQDDSLSYKVWDIDKNEIIYKLETKFPNSQIIISYDAKYAVIYDMNKNRGPFVLSSENPSSITDLNTPVQGSTLVFSKVDYQFAAIGKDNRIYFWDAKKGSLIIKFSNFSKNHHVGSTNKVRFTPDDKYVVSCGNDGTIKFWNSDSGLLVNSYDITRGSVNCLEITSDGKFLAAGSSDSSIYVFQLSSDSLYQLKVIPCSANVTALALGVKKSEVNSYLLVYQTKGQGIIIEDINSDFKNVLDSTASDLTCISFSSDCNKIAAGYRNKHVKFWVNSEGYQLSKDWVAAQTDKDTTGIGSVFFYDSDKKIFTTSLGDEYVRTWETENFVPGYELKMIMGEKVYEAAVDNDKNLAYILDKGRSVHAIKFPYGRNFGNVGSGIHNGNSIALSNSRNRLAFSTADGSIIMYDVSPNSTGVNEDNLSFKNNPDIFPNPASDFLCLKSDYTGSVKIYSPEGLLILESKDKDIINISRLSPGAYLLKSGDKVYMFIKI